MVDIGPGPRDPAREVAVLARPTGQTAFSAARNLQIFGDPHDADPSSGGAARSAVPPAPAPGKRGST
eukprot:4394030-Alexandrium_andersonii.AAC.1